MKTSKIDNTPFEHFGLMIDCSRNAVMNLKSVKKFIDLISAMGYNTLMLYTEDTYEVENQPYFGYLRGRYTCSELKDIDSYALSRNIELIPCIQTLAHLNAIVRWPVYAGIVDYSDILLVGEEKTYKFIEELFSTISKCFSSRKINIGMDEAHMIGLGKYLDRHGFRNRFDILSEHLKKVADIAEKYGFKPLMWSDMFFRLANNGLYRCENSDITEEIINCVPKNVELIYWDYHSSDSAHYENMIKSHLKFNNPIWFAGGAWTWTGFIPHNRFTFETTKAAITACKNQGLKNLLLTMWGDNGGECSYFSVLPSLFYASEVAKGNTDMQDIKHKFQTLIGIPFDDFLLLDLPDTVNNTKVIKNPDKYMLYNDYFMGIFDCTVNMQDKRNYDISAKKLEKHKDNKEWGYLFASEQMLCEAIHIKYDLGLRTRVAYKSHDNKLLSSVIKDYDKLILKLNEFYDKFKILWMTENKPHGFDVQDIRLGGLIKRTESCKERLQQYVSGEIQVIEELEEQLLDVLGNEKDFCKEQIYFNHWSKSTTANVL